MILADSSAWVEFDRATGSAVDLEMVRLISDGGPLAVTEPVVMEVCAGARSDARERELRRLLALPHLLPFDSVADFTGATRIYRRCRQAGVTPRGLIDCMVAAVALRRDVEVLAWDRDLALIAEVLGLKLHAASLR